MIERVPAPIMMAHDELILGEEDAELAEIVRYGT